MFTTENIRTIRPATIKVQCGKQVVDGRIGGWRLDFPVVTFGEYGSAEFAVETLVHCLNNNRPVRV